MVTSADKNVTVSLNGNSKWPSSAIEQWPIEKLVPYEANARTHSRAQIQQIVASIKEWGWTNPILADESGVIIAGHGRLRAAKELDLVSVPVVIARGWSEAQKRAYCLADNQLAMNAGWDLKRLKLAMSELEGWGFETELIGFPETLNADDEWKGMPEFSQTSIGYRTLLVHFQDQEAVDAFCELVGQTLTAQTKFIWYPEVPDASALGHMYESDAEEETL